MLLSGFRRHARPVRVRRGSGRAGRPALGAILALILPGHAAVADFTPPAEAVAVGTCGELPGVRAQWEQAVENESARLEALLQTRQHGPDPARTLAVLLSLELDDEAAVAGRLNRLATTAPTPAWLEDDNLPLVWRRCSTQANTIRELARERLELDLALRAAERNLLELSAAARRILAEADRRLTRFEAAGPVSATPDGIWLLDSLRLLYRHARKGAAPDQALPELLLTAWREAADAVTMAATGPDPDARRRVQLATWLDLAAVRAELLAGHTLDGQWRRADLRIELRLARHRLLLAVDELQARIRSAADTSGSLAWLLLSQGLLLSLLLATIIAAWRVAGRVRQQLTRQILEAYRRQRFRREADRVLRTLQWLKRRERLLPASLGLLALLPCLGLLRLSLLPELVRPGLWLGLFLVWRWLRALMLQWPPDSPAARRHKRLTGLRLIAVALLGGGVLYDALIWIWGPGLVPALLVRFWRLAVTAALLVQPLFWRAELAEGLAGSNNRVLAWLATRLERPQGLLWTLPAVLFHAGTSFGTWIRLRLQDDDRTQVLGDLLFRFRARAHRPEDRREADGRETVPADYQRWFGEPDDVAVGVTGHADETLTALQTRIRDWLDGDRPTPVALVGYPHSGKSRSLTTLAEWARTDATASGDDVGPGDEAESEPRPPLTVVELGFDSHVTDPELLRRRLIEGFGIDDRDLDYEGIKAWLQERETPLLVILDGADRLFLRRLGGFNAYRRFLDLASDSGPRCFWIAGHLIWGWNFLTRAVEETSYALDTVRLRGWEAEALESLIMARHEPTGFDLSWEPLAMIDDSDSRDSERLRQRYFRLLAEQARGNPGIALDLWVRSLAPIGETSLEVHLPELPDLTVLTQRGDDLWFVLAALAIHGSLDAEELRSTTNLAPSVVASMRQRLLAEEVIEQLPNGELRIVARWSALVADALGKRGYLHEV